MGVENGKMQDVIVIGGGLAGLTAALGLAQAGLRVSVVEKKPTRSTGFAANIFPTKFGHSCKV